MIASTKLQSRKLRCANQGEWAYHTRGDAKIKRIEAAAIRARDKRQARREIREEA